MMNLHRLILALCFLSLTNLSAYGQRIYSCPTPNNTTVQGKSMLKLSTWECSEARKEVTEKFPYLTILRPPTSAYNCHGFAWFMSNTAVYIGLRIWIQGPDTVNGIPRNEARKFRPQSEGGDGSYALRQNPGAGNKVHYYAGDHSASQLNNLNVYRSKWGVGPLMQHGLYEVPTIYQSAYVRFYFRGGYLNAEAVEVKTESLDNGKWRLSWILNSDLPEIIGFNVVSRVDGIVRTMNSETIQRMNPETRMASGESYSIEVGGESDGLYLELVGSIEGENMIRF